MISSTLQPYPETSSPQIEENAPVSIEQEQQRSLVKVWLSRISRAKLKWKPDFERMRKNMEFVSGLQWFDQKTIDDPRYINNITLRLVNQKVATLYAKNPTAEVIQRERMDYQVWDEEIESIREATIHATLLQQTNQPLPPELNALFSDFLSGQERKRLVKRVAKTLEKCYSYCVDSQKPEFKTQMKQMVRRTIICSVAFVRPVFCRDNSQYLELSSIDVKTNIDARMGRIKELLNRIEEDGKDTSSADYGTLQSLVMSLGVSQQLQDETQLSERIEFDFPLANSIIVDERCSSIKEFVGARWVAQEYILPVEDVNSIFNTDLKPGISEDEDSAKEFIPENSRNTDPDKNEKLVYVYEVYDKNTKTKFFVCDGHKDYLSPPEVPFPAITGFWPWVCLTFNDIEVDPNSKTSIYPPSDVQLCKNPQMEWNRTREALRDHRNASAPRYAGRKGILTENDKTALRNCVPNQFIDLEGVPPDMKIGDVFAPIPVVPVTPELYDTAPLEQDFMLGVGAQQANLGPAQPNVTATVGTIAEQSRLDVAGSNVDDLDSALSSLAQASGEMILQGFSKQTVQRIVGPGSAFPDSPETRQDFLNEVFLQIKASSSGRPNKAIEVSNFRDLAPLLLQAGANPVGIVEEGARRLDDKMDFQKLFPLTPPESSLSPGGVPSSGSQPQAGPSQPPAPMRPEPSTASPVGNRNQPQQNRDAMSARS